VINGFADLIAVGASTGATQCRVRPMVMLGVVHKLVIEWVLSDNPPPVEQRIRELTDIWLANLSVV
jgi:hypothetical protein